MASGDLNASTPVIVNATAADVEAAIDALNLAATTDRLVVLPVSNGNKVMIFKVERTA